MANVSATPLVQDAVTAGLSARQPWPDEVKLFQPYSVAQSLIPDSSSVVAVKAFLKICGIKYKDELRTNVEFMSPSGKLPFIKVGPIVVSELEPIIMFLQNKGYNLTEHLNDTERADMKAYMTLVENVFVNAELWLTWKDKKIYNEVTKSRYGSPYTWPLNAILPIKKQWQIQRYLQASGWADKSFEKICEEMRTCCEALSERLGDQEYFFGTKATDLDALAFGHLYTLTTTEIPVTRFAEIVNSFPNLTALVKKIHTVYLQDLQLHHS